MGSSGRFVLPIYGSSVLSLSQVDFRGRDEAFEEISQWMRYLQIMHEEIRKKLVGFERDELVELIESLLGMDDAIDQKIAAFAMRRAPSAHMDALRQWIDGWTNGRGVVSYRQSFDLADEVVRVVKVMAALVESESEDPSSVLDLVELFLQSGGAVLESTDDSSGAVSGEFREAAELWLWAAKQCRDAGLDDDWSRRVEKLMESDGYGLLDLLLPRSSILLTDSELWDLAARYESQIKESLGESWEARSASTRLGMVAEALQDSELYVRSVCLKSPNLNTLQKANIVEKHLEFDNPEGALGWLEEPWDGDEWHRLDLLARTFAALGHIGEVIEIRRQIWDLRPSTRTLEGLLGVLPAEEQPASNEEARQRAATIPDLETALELLLFLGQSEDASGLLLQRREELSGNSYYSLPAMSEQFESSSQFLASTLIHRALLDSILDRGYSRAYHHAARYYAHLGRLEAKVLDWHGVDGHRMYLSDLWDQHRRKRAFWSRVGGAPG